MDRKVCFVPNKNKERRKPCDAWMGSMSTIAHPHPYRITWILLVSTVGWDDSLFLGVEKVTPWRG